MKKKIKKKETYLEFRKRISKNIPKDFRVAFPLGKRKSKDQKIPIQIGFDDMWVDFINCKKAIDTLYKEIVPFGNAGKHHVLKKLMAGQGSKQKMHWYTFIMLTEMLGQSPDKLWNILGKYFRREKIQRLKVAMINPSMVALLVNKINKWGGVPVAWEKHRSYLNTWCRRNRVPQFKSFGAFKNLVTDWKEISGIGKRKHKERMKKNVTERVDREFSIYNRPPKS